MRFFRSALFAAVCALAILCSRSLLRAQPPTAADKATYQEFLKTCSAEIAGMKTFLASKGEPMTDAQLREFMEPMPSQLRAAAREEKLTFAAALRESRASFVKDLNDPNNPDKSTKVLGPTMLCFFDMLIRREAAPAPKTAASVDKPIEGCVKIDERPQGWVGFKNVCSFPVDFAYCGSKPARGSASEAFSCEAGKFGRGTIAAGGVRAAPINDVDTAYWFACRQPKIPSGAKFDGTDLVGTCK